MYTITPLRPQVTDAATGLPLPAQGIARAVLLPPDHAAERVGDVRIAAAPLAVAKQAAPAKPFSAPPSRPAAPLVPTAYVPKANAT